MLGKEAVFNDTFAMTMSEGPQAVITESQHRARGDLSLPPYVVCSLSADVVFVLTQSVGALPSHVLTGRMGQPAQSSLRPKPISLVRIFAPLAPDPSHGWSISSAMNVLTPKRSPLNVPSAHDALPGEICSSDISRNFTRPRRPLCGQEHVARAT